MPRGRRETGARGSARARSSGAAAGPLEHVSGLRPQVGGNLPVELGEQRRRAIEVEGLGLDELVGRPRPQPVGECTVKPGALALREAAVGDVADEDVTETERRLARDRRERLARQELTVDEVFERRVDVERGVELRNGAAPEDAPDEGAVPDDRP